MLPHQLIDPERQLKIAKRHAEELRNDWRVANGVKDRPYGPGLVATVRESAGRAFVGLGRRLLLARHRPRSSTAPARPAGSGC